MSRAALLCLALSFGVPPSLGSGCGDLGRVRYEPRTFLGYACEDDCKRHKAGYAWAELRQADSLASCEGLGTAEAEGCQAYVEAPGGAGSAGLQWALENEISSWCECAGAGERFRRACESAAETRMDPAP